MADLGRPISLAISWWVGSRSNLLRRKSRQPLAIRCPSVIEFPLYWPYAHWELSTGGGTRQPWRDTIDTGRDPKFSENM